MRVSARASYLKYQLVYNARAGKNEMSDSGKHSPLVRESALVLTVYPELRLCHTNERSVHNGDHISSTYIAEHIQCILAHPSSAAKTRPRELSAPPRSDAACNGDAGPSPSARVAAHSDRTSTSPVRCASPRAASARGCVQTPTCTPGSCTGTSAPSRCGLRASPGGAA